METLSVVQALIIALWIGAVMSRSFLGGATTTLRFTPMMTGLVCGIVMGGCGSHPADLHGSILPRRTDAL